MIQTSLSNLIIYNLCGLLGILGLVWIFRVIRQFLGEHRRHRHRVVCAICGHLFRNATKEQAFECPACHHMVERRQVLDL